MRRSGHLLALAVHIGLVELLVPSVRTGSPHPREDHFALREVFRIHRSLGLDVLPVHRGPVFLGFKLIRGIEVLAVEQRRGAVLLTGEVAHKGERVVRLVLVGRSLGAGANDVDAEHREADHDGGEAEQGSVEHNLTLLQAHEQAPETQGEEEQDEESGAAVVRQPEHVHEEQVHVRGEFREVRDDHEENQREQHHPDEEDLAQLPESERPVLAFAVVKHEHESRNHQQVEQVHTYAQTHHEGDEHYPLVGVRAVRAVVPHRHRPEGDGGEQGGHCIYLSLDSGEPEGIGEAVRERAHQTSGKYRYGLAAAVCALC